MTNGGCPQISPGLVGIGNDCLNHGFLMAKWINIPVSATGAAWW